MRIVIDGQHLADHSPLARFCIPYPTQNAKSAQARVEDRRRKENTYQDLDKVRTELSQRKAAEKLPKAKALWELVRILWTEKPVTLADHIRFAQGKIGVLTGFRVGENATIPFDWGRWREYVDAQGRPAGERGGISRSLMLRNFVEKPTVQAAWCSMRRPNTSRRSSNRKCSTSSGASPRSPAPCASG